MSSFARGPLSKACGILATILMMVVMSRALMPLAPCILRRANLHARRVAFVRTTATYLEVAAQSDSNSSGIGRRNSSLPSAVVTWAGPEDRVRASTTAERFGLPLVARTVLLETDTESLSEPIDFALQFAGPAEEAPLELHGLPFPVSRSRSSKDFDTDASGSTSKRKGQTRGKRERSSLQPPIGPLAVDFVALRDGRGSQSSGGSELVVKACKGKKGGLGVVWDLTAGLGRDATLLALASSGGVVMFERSVVMSALLDDALRRLAIDEGHSQGGEESNQHAFKVEEGMGGDQNVQTGDGPSESEFQCSDEDAFFEDVESGQGLRNGRISGFDLSRRLQLVAGDAISLLADGPTNEQNLVSSSTLASLPPSASDANSNKDEKWRQQRPDVVYLDPMFPPRQKSALVKGEMQLLHRLLHPRTVVPGSSTPPEEVTATTSDDEMAGVTSSPASPAPKDEEAAAESEGFALLKCGLAWATRRTVVKRPKNAPPLGGQKPSHSVKGSVSRFDVYVAPGASKSTET